MAQSLDSVLADVDASDEEIANTQPVEQETPLSIKNDPPEEAGQGDDDDQGPDAIGALHAERNRVRRKYTDTVADFERKLAETNTGFEKKLAETLAQNDQRWEQRFNQFAQTIQPRQEPKPKPERPDLYEDGVGFVQHGVREEVEPLKSEFAQFREHVSRRDAIRDHGEEKVQAAFSALHQAGLSGSREAQETIARVKQSMDPYGDMVTWHQRTSVLSEFGSNPEAAIQKRLEAALEDPAHLAKAAEKLGVRPKPQPQGDTQPLPSLNRATAAAGNDDDEEDAREVFNTALRSGVRR